MTMSCVSGTMWTMYGKLARETMFKAGRVVSELFAPISFIILGCTADQLGQVLKHKYKSFFQG